MSLWLAIVLLGAGATVATLTAVAFTRRRRRRSEEARGHERPGERRPLSRADKLTLLGTLVGAAGVATGVVGLFVKEGQSSTPSLPKIRIDLAASRLNPAGNDRASDEYVCLVNYGDKTVDVGGWVLRDSIHDVNTLPELLLSAGQKVRVHPGKGVESHTDVFGAGNRAAWNNQGDTVTLLDADGRKVDSRSYGPREQNDGTASCGPALPAPSTTSTSTQRTRARTDTSTQPAPQPERERTRTTEGVGSTSHAEDSLFCSTHTCIGDFTTQAGTIVECVDGTYSHAGGSSGACSRHGGVRSG